MRVLIIGTDHGTISRSSVFAKMLIDLVDVETDAQRMERLQTEAEAIEHLRRITEQRLPPKIELERDHTYHQPYGKKARRAQRRGFNR